MLDEIKENDQYQLVVNGTTSPKNCRLSYTALVNGLDGLSRAFEIRCRDLIFHYGIKDTPSIEEIEKIKADLLSWYDSFLCSAYVACIAFDKNKFLNTEKEEGSPYTDKHLKEHLREQSEDFLYNASEPAFLKWSKVKMWTKTVNGKPKNVYPNVPFKGNYWRIILLIGNKRKQIVNNDNPSEKKGGGKSKEYSVLSSLADSNSDINRIYLDKIIAQSLEKGPLKKYVLVEKKATLSNAFIGNEQDGLTKGNADYIAKWTAAYLLEQRWYPNQKWLPLTDVDILNWSKIVRKEKGTFFFKTKKRSFPIFEKQYIHDQKNIVKYKPHDKWIQNFELLDITEEGALKKWEESGDNIGKIYYIDQGSGKPLKKVEVGEKKIASKENSGKTKIKKSIE